EGMPMEKIATKEFDPLGYLSAIDKETFDPIVLKKARIKLNLSQEGFAREIGVSFPTYSGWERGRQKPSYDGLDKLRRFADNNRH
ncbi:MAG: helix-turn-helix transcriptional regulator, partial [Candidatus Tectomicrobia bacterium]|nr:helix-turn-helix transcriptional regulator [Candidatus Tectomicrobia bacterium]